MGFEDLERRLLESMSIPSAEGTPPRPPGRGILVAPNDRFARTLHDAVDPLTSFAKNLVDALGINILVNGHLPKRTIPLRQHKLRHGHTAYHKRIQKKWAKRFGTKEVDCWYVTSAPHPLEPLR